MNRFYTYIVRCSDGSLYTGSCQDLDERVQKHNLGEGAKYTAQRRPVEVVYYEIFILRTEAMKREYQIKRWTRIKKENLIRRGQPTKF